MEDLTPKTTKVCKQVAKLANNFISFPINQQMVNLVLRPLVTDYSEYEWNFETNEQNTMARISFRDENDSITYVAFGEQANSEKLLESMKDVIPDSEKMIYLPPSEYGEKVTLH